ncbi:hypothetical protein AB1Y20_008064 [Prymnesium parvum]|uniref:Uncharacterized protein n=1 Tax=Prymnesium parvum TaxID=97485 RepID=A0AB34IVT2_PRYPA|mmetsp:Transcript_13030/g.32541  ORF Transcript_13030/g.32541 Transcript_13030/m.32541 type:complete len:216 (-) Transcript_13030:15-662(-)
MDFSVPDTAGVGPADPALLRSRGADPLVEIPVPHFFHSVAGLPFQPVLGALSPVPTLLPLSIVEAVLGPMIAVDRSAPTGVAMQALFSTLILPSKFEAALSQSFLESPAIRLDPNRQYSSLSAAAAAVQDFTRRLDPAALHPAYVLTSADVFVTEPVLGSSPAPFRTLFSTTTAVTFGGIASESGFLTHLSFLGCCSGSAACLGFLCIRRRLRRL